MIPDGHVVRASAGRGASWSDDGAFIVAALDNQSSLVRIPAEGGTPVQVTKFSGEERTHRWPQVLPGHRAVLFTANSAAGNFVDSRIGVATIADGQTAPSDHTILPVDAAMYPRYIASGHLIFVKKNGLYAAPFDRSQLRIVGTPVQVLDDVSNDASIGTVQIDVSESGTLLYHRGGSVGLRSIQWTYGSQVEPLLPEAAMYIYPRVASDGDRVAFTNADESNGDIWVYSTRTRTKTRVTSGPGQKAYPTWTPDGRHLVFSASGTLFWVPADAARPPQVLMRSDGAIAPAAFTPDGKTLALVVRSDDGKWSLRTAAVRTGPNGLEAGAAEPFVDLPSGAVTAAFSPDGRWLAYTSSESGPFEVYVRGFPDTGTKRLVSSGGGMMPMWSPNGKDIFYRTQDQRLMVASYTVKDGAFIADPPRSWSTQRLANSGMSGNVDLAPDGTRFVVLMPADAAESRETRGHYTLVTNFFDAVRQKLAASPK